MFVQLSIFTFLHCRHSSCNTLRHQPNRSQKRVAFPVAKQVFAHVVQTTFFFSSYLQLGTKEAEIKYTYNPNLQIYQKLQFKNQQMRGAEISNSKFFYLKYICIFASSKKKGKGTTGPKQAISRYPHTQLTAAFHLNTFNNSSIFYFM